MAVAANTVRVWDSFVRIGHWTLVAAFATAYLTGDDRLEVHEWAGYFVGAYLVLRIAWGFAGTVHARFADFLYTPRRAVAYLIDMLHRRAKRYLGHSPAGSVMVFALLAALSGTVITGMAEIAASHGEGPLSGIIERNAQPPPAQIEAREERESTLRETHELFANLTLILIALHIGGVVVASFSHRENLVLSMINGRKPASTSDRSSPG